jgi:hypothetical protein
MSRTHSIDSTDLDRAGRNLSKFVRTQAHCREARLGLRWRASETAPRTFEDLEVEYRVCLLTGTPMRVSSMFSENTVYDSPRTNHAARFWHDTNHVLLGYTFCFEHEVELACRQLEALRAEGFGARSLEHRLLHADTFGQIICEATIGRFPHNQRRFDYWCVTDGVDEAVAYEASKGPTAEDGDESRTGRARHE